MILLICNPVSGGNKAKVTLSLFRIYAQIMELKFDLYLTQKASDYAGIKTAFEQTKPTMVVSCGGDGTANDVVNALASYLDETPLLILPSGSGNDFSTQLYGNKEPKELFELVHSTRTKRVDLGICNQHLFVNGIGIGFDGAIAKNTASNKNRFLPTKFKYYLAIFKNILFFKEFRYQTQKSEKKRLCFMLAIANGKNYGGGFKIAPQAALDDGLLDVVEIGPIKPYKRPFYIPKVEKGKHLQLDFVDHYQTKEIEIFATDQNMLPAHADGEYFENNYFKISMLKDALLVPLFPA